MTNLRKSVYLLMASMLFSAPLLACTLPGMTMSEEEKECCKQMADQCGGSQMDDSHSCCTKAPADSSVQKPVSKYSSATPDMVTALLSDVHQAASSIVQFTSFSVADSSKSPPGISSILRI